MKKFLCWLVLTMLFSLLIGCAAVEGLAAMLGGGTVTAEDGAAVEAGINAIVGLFLGDYAGALYWGMAAMGGSAYTGMKATQAAGAGVRAVNEKRKAKKLAHRLGGPNPTQPV